MSKKHDDGLDDLFAGLPESTSAPPPKAPLGADDPLAQLDELESLAERPKPAGAKRSMERSRTPGLGYGLPPSARNSSEVKRSPEKATTPSAPPSPPKQAEAPKPADNGGGWGWGSLWSTATTAVKAAEGLVQEIQQSEEGKKWVTQVKGNADVLRGLGTNHYALPLPVAQVPDDIGVQLAMCDPKLCPLLQIFCTILRRRSRATNS
jgi:predicted component of type VI protein secretion system